MSGDGSQTVSRADGALYALFGAALTLVFAHAFYGYMRVQTGGDWSAPLDDVFIHFDYARAIARGHPFEWSEGNGYSSGNTSLLYPFALAVGYWAGFRKLSLVVWSGIVACLSMLGFLWAARRLFDGMPRWAKYLAPLATFSVGALDWSIFSGMEVAFFLAVWALALAATYAVVDADDARSASRRGLLLGLAAIVVVCTRPEGASSVAVLGVVAALSARRFGRRTALATLFGAGLPPVVALVAQSLANKWLTGESASNGAIVKLPFYNPYMTRAEKLDEYVFLLKYVVMRNADYHFADARPYGWFVPALAAVPLVPSRTRRAALILWASALSWLAIVALNAQVRWQNERYTMPAVAWILLAAALGLAVLVAPGFALRDRTRARLAAWGARAVVGLALAALFVVHQGPRMRDQIWFFGRASRNIRDQHIVAGRLLADPRLSPPAHRILVGDAGALMYASDRPGLDIIGLGGYHDLPFARASVHGLGATLELIERMPPQDRPDYFAIYPSWWGDLPSWFGEYVAAIPVHGNVICGGSEKVIYRADWSALGTGQAPRTLRPGERVTDELDVADLVSERAHGYDFSHPQCGFVDARILPDPSAPTRDLFDAGRRIPDGRVERFHVRVRGRGAARLVFRTVGDHAATVEVRASGSSLGTFAVQGGGGWQERSIDLPPSAPDADVAVVVSPVAGGDWVDHHVWVVEGP